MKKILFILSIFIIFSLPVHAEEIIVSDDDESDILSADEYIPNELTEILSQNGISVSDENISDNLFSFILSVISEGIKEECKQFGIVLSLMIISATVYKIIDNTTFKKIISYIITLCISVCVIDIFSLLMTDTRASLTAVSDMIKVITPAFSAILLMGGGSVSAVTSAASLGAVLTLLETVLNSVISPCVTLMLIFSVFERLSSSLGDLNCVSVIKKHIITAISFITMLMLTVISFQTLLASSKDSMSIRTVKFAAANFIPIVGNAVGEAFKTVSAGLKYIKTTLGVSAALSIAVTVLPTVIRLFLVKLGFGFLGFFGGMTSCSSEKSLLLSFSSVIDIMLAIIICVTVLSILIAVLFITCGSAVISL